MTMWQKIRELICREAEMTRFPKKDKEYDHIIYQISHNTESNTELDINTLKNLFDHWGKGMREPNENTKEAISEFLGFNDWEDLTDNIDDVYDAVTNNNRPIHKKNISVLGFDDKNVEINTLEKGREIIINYSPDRKVKVRVLGDNRYKVISSINSSLIEDDEITIKSFQLGVEFVAFEIKRYGHVLGDYIAARGHVITKVIICP